MLHTISIFGLLLITFSIGSLFGALMMYLAFADVLERKNEHRIEAIDTMKRQTSSETLPDSVLEAALIITERIEDFIIDDVVNDPYKLIKAYKQAAAIAHPDRGGSQEEFVALQSSLVILKCWHENKTTDELKLEVEIAYELDDIAAELNGIAEQLRRKPYAAVEGQLKSQQARLAEVRLRGKVVKENAC